MKNFKKLLAVLLAGLMLLSLVACGGKESTDKSGVLEMEMLQSAVKHTDDCSIIAGSNGKKSREIYSNLSAALMDLESGKIVTLCVDETVAKYIVAQNDKFEFSSGGPYKTGFSMLTKESNTEVYNILNNAIKEMKADGTLDSLIANELKAYIESDPVAKDLPHFDGAKTIKIGVTGDLPPMDFVAANGQAAGFNIALLTEIANRAKVNFELVQIDAGARAMALSSGKIDAAFWTKYITCDICNSAGAEKIDGNLITESYFSSTGSIIQLKSDK